jgi:hypothetical protein
MLELIITTIGVRTIAILAALLLIINIALGVTLKILSARLDVATAKTLTQTVQLQTLGDQITAQNGAVDQMLANAAASAGRIKTATTKAARVESITRDRIEYIEHSEIPAPCPDAIKWGAKHAIEIGKRWEAAP